MNCKPEIICFFKLLNNTLQARFEQTIIELTGSYGKIQ